MTILIPTAIIACSQCRPINQDLMTGRYVDNMLYAFRKHKHFDNLAYLDTDFGKIRIFDSGGSKPVIINVPDAPNTIEHQINLLQELSKSYRVVCYEYPGTGFSYPNPKFNYSFDHGAELIFQVMDILRIEITSLIFSCSNGYYALNAAMASNQRFEHIFIIQTPSISSIINWTEISVPSILKIPVIGQISNKVLVKKLAHVWYDVALPRGSECKNEFSAKAHHSLTQGSCFCLSSLVQGLSKEKHKVLKLYSSKVTLVWGLKDFSHRNTLKTSILEHVKDCEVVEFSECGHFPELENTSKFVKLVNERLN